MNGIFYTEALLPFLMRWVVSSKCKTPITLLSCQRSKEFSMEQNTSGYLIFLLTRKNVVCLSKKSSCPSLRLEKNNSRTIPAYCIIPFIFKIYLIEFLSKFIKRNYAFKNYSFFLFIVNSVIKRLKRITASQM